MCMQRPNTFGARRQPPATWGRCNIRNKLFARCELKGYQGTISSQHLYSPNFVLAHNARPPAYKKCTIPASISVRRINQEYKVDQLALAAVMCEQLTQCIYYMTPTSEIHRHRIQCVVLCGNRFASVATRRL